MMNPLLAAFIGWPVPTARGARAPFAVIARRHLVVAAFVCFAVACSFAEAKEKGPLEINLKAQTVVVSVDGSETLKNNAAAAPGNIVLYTATYSNTSAKALNNLQATLPIPTTMQYVENSASPAPVEASLDGKTFEPIPLHRTRKLPSGAEVAYEVPASSYRAIRWAPSALGANATSTFTARARITTAQ